MAEHSESSEISVGLADYVDSIGLPVSPGDLDIVLKYRAFEGRDRRLRTLLDVWKNERDQDRATRKYYAKWLLVVVCLQILVINILFVVIGLRFLDVDAWTANTFIVSVFAEISAMVLIVVNYLFPKSKASDSALVDVLRRSGSE